MSPSSRFFALVCLLVGAVTISAQPYTFKYFSGHPGGAGFADGRGTEARFSGPAALARDAAGNLYVSERYRNVIRRITPDGDVVTFAGVPDAWGSADGPSGIARFSDVNALAVDVAGNVIVADTGNATIRKITPAGYVTTIAGQAGELGREDGPAAEARFESPCGLAVATDGTIFVSDCVDATIRRIDPDGMVSTIAGAPGSYGFVDGAGSESRFQSPRALAMGPEGLVYVADSSAIRKVTAAGVVSTVPGTAGALVHSVDLAIDANGQIFALADYGERIAKWNGDVVSTLLPSDPEPQPRFESLAGIELVGDGSVYVSDEVFSSVMKVSAAGELSPFAGVPGGRGNSDGQPTEARFRNARRIATDLSGNLYVTDGGSTIRRISPLGVVTTIAGAAMESGSEDGAGDVARFSGVEGIARAPDGTFVVADSDSGTIRRVTPGGLVTTIAGTANEWGTEDGRGAAARFWVPRGVAVDASGNIYVADTGNDTIRKIDPDGWVTTLAGSPGNSGYADGTGAAARFNYPRSLVIDRDGTLLVADTNNHRIRRVTPAGLVTTFAGSGDAASRDGTGTGASFYGPTGLALHENGDVYVAGAPVRRITPAGVVTSLGEQSYSGRGLREWTAVSAEALAFDPDGNLYLTAVSSIRIGRQGLGDKIQIGAPLGRTGVVRTLDTTPVTATSWQWSVVLRPFGSTAALVSPDTRTPAFTPDLPGEYWFRLLASDSGKESLTYGTLSVTEGPVAVVSGGGSSCAGAGVAISASLTGFAPWTLTWSDGAKQSGITESPVTRTVYPNATTTYRVVSIVDALGEGTPSGSATVVVRTSPVAYLSGAPVCPGGSATITAVLAGTAPWTVIWSDGLVQTVTSSPATRSVVADKTMALGIDTITDAYCTASSIAFAPIQVLREPVIIHAPAYVCAGQLAYVQGPELSLGVTYTWSVTGGSISSGQGSSRLGFVNDGTGPVTVSLEISNGTCTVHGHVVVPLQQCPGPAPEAYVFTHLAGTEGGPGSVDGIGSAARFNGPGSVAVDASGSIFVADANGTIRKVAPSGEVSTFAGMADEIGYVDGQGAQARLARSALTMDRTGTMFVLSGNSIRRLSVFGTVTTIAGSASFPGSADGIGTAARFNKPAGIAVDAAGNLYVADLGNSTIRKVTPSGIVSTVAGKANVPGSGDGTGSAARFSAPSGVACDPAGNLFVADTGNHTIRKVTPSGVVTTIAGSAGMQGNADGSGPSARFDRPERIALDGTGAVYVSSGFALRRISNGGVVSTVAGKSDEAGYQNGVGSAARFAEIGGIAVDPSGNLTVGDTGNHVIRRVTPAGTVTTAAGFAREGGSADGKGADARFLDVRGLTVDQAGNVFVADSSNSTVRKIDPDGSVTTIAGAAGEAGADDGQGSAARFDNPMDVAVDPEGNVFVADTGNYTIRKIDPEGFVETVAGLAGARGGVDATGNAARMIAPGSLSFDAVGNLYVADWTAVRRLDGRNALRTVAGSPLVTGSADGVGRSATFGGIRSLAVGTMEVLWVADTTNHTIRWIDRLGTVKTEAGEPGAPGSLDATGHSSRFNGPTGLAVDREGRVFLADSLNSTLRRLQPLNFSYDVTTVGGRPSRQGTVDGTGSLARFNAPSDVAVDARGNLYVSDPDSACVRVGRLAIPDAATIDASSAEVGVLRQLGVSPRNATSWDWRIVRRPAGSSAELSSTSIPDPTFTPDRADRYEFELRARSEAGISITRVVLDTTASQCRQGDLNGNQQVSALDASLALQLAVGAMPPGPGQRCAGDYNGNGSITAFDAAMILQCVVGTGPCP